MRLEGLDSSNSNALSRAIVVHGAWYVNEHVIDTSGMLGRSQGCLPSPNLAGLRLWRRLARAV